jgi:hypothetical protein
VFWQTLSIEFVAWAVDNGRISEKLAEDKAEIAAVVRKVLDEYTVTPRSHTL